MSRSTLIVDALLWRPLHLLVGWIMMACVIFLERKAFCVHVVGVTFLLLVVLHKINMCYGQMANKFLLYEQVVIAGGIVHTIVPMIGMVYPVAMYLHVGICFTVHILHLMQCYQVFNDIKMNDTQYIIILWVVNIFEFAANFAYCFPAVISGQNFAVILVGVEVSALLISSLKLKVNNRVQQATASGKVVPVSAGNTSSKSNVSNESNASRNKPKTPSNSFAAIEPVAVALTSRLFVMFSAQIFAVLLLALPNSGFPIFITGFGGFLAIAVVKFRESYSISVDNLLIVALYPFVGLLVLAWLLDAKVLPKTATIVFNIVIALPSCAFLLNTIYRHMGTDHYFQLPFAAFVLFIIANIYYPANVKSKVLQVLMCATIAAMMLVCLSSIRRGDASNANTSKSGNHKSSNSEGHDDHNVGNINANTNDIAVKSKDPKMQELYVVEDYDP